MTPVLRALPTWKDNDPKNQGADYRKNTQVDIEKRGDASNGYGVGWINAGEWLNYTVEVKESGTYDIKIPVAAQKVGGLFSRILRFFFINFSNGSLRLNSSYRSHSYS